MRLRCWLSRRRNDEGQGLLETALTMPLLLGLAFNIVNFGYYWFMILTLAAAPRMGVQFSAQGGGVLLAPSPTAVSTLVFENMTNAVHGATTSNTAVRVCSSTVGVDANGVAKCQPFGDMTFTFSNVAADPEKPVFVLNRVDVGYTVTPIIPGTVFNILLPPTFKFHRQVSMRSLY